LKVALVHDWLTGMRGGEKVLSVLCECFPSADLYTLVHARGTVSKTIESRRVVTSFIQKLPFAKKAYRSYLPLFPMAIEGMRLKGYDLVISTSHCVAKGIIPPANALHICYIHTPMRYVWDMYHEYLGSRRGLSSLLARAVAHYLRIWDASSSGRVDHFIANSLNIARKVKRYYGREAEVIHPPVDCSKFSLNGKKGEYYLVVSAFVPYKRVDLAIKALNTSGRKLVVAGKGPEEKKLKKLAWANVEFTGWKTDSELARLYQGARALIFPGEEDFGLVPLEAMASGSPVIAYGRGGALETVVPPGTGRNATGLFFVEQDPRAVMEAVSVFERSGSLFRPDAIREHALGFDRTVFKEKLSKSIEARYLEFTRNGYAKKAQPAL